MVLNTLFSASGYRNAIKMCKDCVIENIEAVENFDNFTGPSDDFVCQYIIYIVKKLNVQNIS